MNSSANVQAELVSDGDGKKKIHGKKKTKSMALL